MCSSISTISNSRIFLLRKCEQLYNFFQQKYKCIRYAIFNDQSFNDN